MRSKALEVNLACISRAAAIIEGHETHRRTAEVPIDLKKQCGLEERPYRVHGGKYVKVLAGQRVIVDNSCLTLKQEGSTGLCYFSRFSFFLAPLWFAISSLQRMSGPGDLPYIR
jgi:hypothetical protein